MRGLSFLRQSYESGQDFVITGKHTHPQEHLFHSPLTLPLHPYGSLTVKTRDQILLKVCIPPQSHTSIPFTFLMSDCFISSVRLTPLCKHSELPLLKWWWKCWVLPTWDACMVTLQTHCGCLKMCTLGYIMWKAVFPETESKQMSGHGLVWSITLLGTLFQEREVGACEVPAKNRDIWASWWHQHTSAEET